MGSNVVTLQTESHPAVKDHKYSITEMRFIQYYTAIGKTSQGNATESYWLARDGKCKRSTAGVEGCKLLKEPRVQDAINSIMHAEGMDRQVREKKLASIINGTHIAVSTVSVKKRAVVGFETDANGKEIPIYDMIVDQEIETARTPTGGDIIRAVDVANRMDGTYAANKAIEGAMTQELKALFKDARKNLNTAPSKSKPANTPDPRGAQGEGGNGPSAPPKSPHSDPQPENTEGGVRWGDEDDMFD